MGIFSSRSDLELQLEREVAESFAASGMPPREAKRTAREMVKDAKREADSAMPLPPNAGDIILQREADPNADPSAKAASAKRRAEGVTDTDILWWWNQTGLERRLLKKVDDWFRTNFFFSLRATGLSEEASAAKVRKVFPFFGDPADTTHASGDDRPLPYELKDRINTWTQRQTLSNADEYRERVEKSTSFNAIVREEIRAGKL